MKWGRVFSGSDLTKIGIVFSSVFIGIFPIRVVASPLPSGTTLTITPGVGGSGIFSATPPRGREVCGV